MKDLSRRDVLALGTTAAAAALFVNPLAAHAETDLAKDLIKKFTGGKNAAEGKIKLEMPEIAENGKYSSIKLHC